MFNRLFALSAAVLFVGLAASPAQSQIQLGPMILRSAADRATIRATPILERPNRVGHFYGNTVRRRSSRPMTAPMRPRATFRRRR